MDARAPAAAIVGSRGRRKCTKRGLERRRSCVLRADWRPADRPCWRGCRPASARRRQLLAAGVSTRRRSSLGFDSGRVASGCAFAVSTRSGTAGRWPRARHWAALLLIGSGLGDQPPLGRGRARGSMRPRAAWSSTSRLPGGSRPASPASVSTRRMLERRARAPPSKACPITSPAQTLFDLATMLGDASACTDVRQRGRSCQRLVTLDDLHRHPRRGRHRRARARADFASDARPHRSRRGAGSARRSRPASTPSSAARALSDRGSRTRASGSAGEPIEPDVLWREQRVIVEADGRDPAPRAADLRVRSAPRPPAPRRRLGAGPGHVGRSRRSGPTSSTRTCARS